MVLADGFRTGWSLLIDGLMPPACVACKAPVAQAGLYCADCWAALQEVPAKRCAQCAIPLPLAWGAEALCLACVERPPPFAAAWAAYPYAGPARQTVLQLKNGGEHLAPLMAAAMARACAALPPETGVAAVPLHRWRLMQRGFNQAVLLARRLARALELDFRPDVLERVRPTPSTRGLGRAARASVMAGAFRVADSRRIWVKGRPILLVDDVMTSGATAAACARALKRAGAGPVAVITYARVAGPEAGAYVAASAGKDGDGDRRDLYQIPVPLLHPGEKPVEGQGRDPDRA